MNVAIVAPNQNAYYETYIQAHKRIDANVFFYFDGYVPNQLEGVGTIDQSQWISLIKRGWIKLFNSKQLYSELLFARSIRINKIDVVFAEYGLTGAALTKVCKKLKMPLVTIFHGLDASVKDVIEKYRAEYNELFQYASKIIAVSGVMEEKLISLGCPKDKIVRTPCAPGNLFLDIEPTYSEPQSFVAIGRFVNKKAPYYTILAIKKVAEKYPEVKLYFAGDGELFNTAQNLIKYFRLEQNVKLLGIISPDEYISILSKVTGFIQHSITATNGDMEGTPVSVLEASAAGIPVVATRHAGIPDVIVDCETGLLVDEHDVDGMATQIIRLIENPDLVRKLGQCGKGHIKMHFSMDKHLEIIRSALEGARST